MHWHVRADNFCKKFDSAQKALTYARSCFERNSYKEVLVEKCGSKACFTILKYRSKRLSSIFVI